MGPTPYYVFPYGEVWWKDGLAIEGRVPLDGRGLRRRFSILSPFLHPKQVWDPLRPAQISY